MAQMQVTELPAFGALRFDGSRDGAGSRTPGHNEQIAFGITFGQHIGNILGNRGDFRGTDTNHVLVVERLVIDVAGAVLFFEAPDAVLEARGAGKRPGAGKRLWVALVG